MHSWHAISGFRDGQRGRGRDNSAAIVGACRAFVLFCRDHGGTGARAREREGKRSAGKRSSARRYGTGMAHTPTTPRMPIAGFGVHQCEPVLRGSAFQHFLSIECLADAVWSRLCL